MMIEPGYTYKAKVIRWKDGDTVVVIADLGMKVFHEVELRLAKINTPELKGEERELGLKAKAFVEEKLPVGSEIVIKTYKDRKEKYGRWLAEIYFDFEGGQICINELLLKEGLAKLYET